MSDRYPEFPPDAVSVTEILKAVGLIDDRWFNDEARDRGTVVHDCCQLLAHGILNWSTVDERIAGYVNSYEKLLEHTGWLAESVEVAKYDDQLKFCGRFDVNYFKGILGDLKTGAPAKWHRAQLGAYWRLNGETGKVCGIYLQADGSTAKLKFHNGRECWNEFLTALNFFRLQENYGSNR